MKDQKKIKDRRPRAEQIIISDATKLEIISQVKHLAEQLCEAESMELVHVEYQREAAGRILRLYIDKPGGVSLDDCVNINRQLGDLLDINLEHLGPYNLEVSSPGTDRPLGKQSDYERFKGNVARIKTSKPIDGQKNFKGILSGASDGKVTLVIEDKSVAIPFDKISRARLVDYHGEN
jgi:ribosome maturation factor RimP